MSDNYASGNWIVKEGRSDEFVARWREFLDWTASEVPGLVSATLIRDTDDGRHFVSLAEWESVAAIETWRSKPEFAAKLGACRALCDEFRGANFVRVVAIAPVKA